MTAIYYDAADDRIMIEGALQSYAPRTLMALLDGDTVMVRLKVNTRNEYGPAAYGEIRDAAGAGFPSAASALAYLQGEFAKRPRAGDLYAIPVDIASPGQTVIPLQQPPSVLSAVRVEVNGGVYRAPDIAATNLAVTWLNPDFSLTPNDTVTVVYS